MDIKYVNLWYKYCHDWYETCRQVMTSKFSDSPYASPCKHRLTHTIKPTTKTCSRSNHFLSVKDPLDLRYLAFDPTISVSMMYPPLIKWPWISFKEGSDQICIPHIPLIYCNKGSCLPIICTSRHWVPLRSFSCTFLSSNKIGQYIKFKV